MQNSINVESNQQKCHCSNCQTQTGPTKMIRHFKSKVEIISSDDRQKVQDRYDRFVNFILSFNGRIQGTPFSTTTGTYNAEPYVQYSILVCYEIPNNVDDKVMIGAYERQ